MRRAIAALLTGSVLVFSGVACDDNEKAKDGGQGGIIDEDDTNVGPGDGNDETGPGR